jgi:tRNA-2-methylthio-N6-dimethylallyladenosine synthase
MAVMPHPRKVYLETYGCQMNLADSELIQGIMKSAGYDRTPDLGSADIVLVNTCSIRENAEQRIYGRLGDFRHYKRQNPAMVIGVLGCMAERLRRELMESDAWVDIVVGPDEYRRLPDLVHHALAGERGIAVRLSKVETYDDIIPLRTEGISAWVSIMRGCDKFCTFCVVPYTRGRERSRPLSSIVREIESLSAQGFKEVTLLGQNVNSYRDPEAGYDFAEILDAVAHIDTTMRIRFTTSHPEDMSSKLIQTIARGVNICNSIHLPVQSGSDRILRLMNRTYDRRQYLDRVQQIRSIIPGVSLSSDIIAGFPSETETDHQMTLDLMEEVRFDGAFTFKYSPREKTKAWAMLDDVTEDTKVRRLHEIIELQRGISGSLNAQLVGQTVEVLVEGVSTKSPEDLCGRTASNKMVVFPRCDVRPGEYVMLEITRSNAATLFGRVLKSSAEAGSAVGFRNSVGNA